MGSGSGDPHRDWDAGWRQLRTTVDDDLGLVTERIKLRYLRPHLKACARSLEIGCGSAKLSALLAKDGLEVFGVDLSPQALRVARNNFQYLGVRGHVAIADAFALPFEAEQFDLVFSTGLLEHFRDPERIIREMLRTLRPGGLFFSDVVPLKFSLVRSAWYLRGLHRTVDDEHPYRPRDVRRWLHACDLVDVRVFSSCILPALGLMRLLPKASRLCRLVDPLATAFDNTVVADALGFFYLAFGRKPVARG
jgi:SAM-dependent methyltransferase